MSMIGLNPRSLPRLSSGGSRARSSGAPRLSRCPTWRVRDCSSCLPCPQSREPLFWRPSSAPSSWSPPLRQLPHHNPSWALYVRPAPGAAAEESSARPTLRGQASVPACSGTSGRETSPVRTVRVFLVTEDRFLPDTWIPTRVQPGPPRQKDRPVWLERLTLPGLF